ncbi:polysaccharide deacetylase family protein [Paenibacillus ginsengarvi]|uniref:Polysaccharide deacetylase n=1 Tax=Paenibacillus ginsengarvi TaxID=400777 RepID=A0A3B0CPG5_9BACL|nr:polysaccharide deacetylase family protein [Paenibacillus ginsengarvi]RKN86214.1 polysaccharide deacetylase [Paenibacillus ginsengarvi]
MKRTPWISLTVIVILMSTCGCGQILDSGPPVSSMPIKSQSEQSALPGSLQTGPNALSLNNVQNAPASGKELSGKTTTASEPPREPATLADPNPNGAAATSKTAYLTFDDGPSENTEPIIDILRRFNVKATFFVIGDPSQKGRMLYRKIAENGHVIGNHTYTHDYSVVYKSVAGFKRDVEKLDELLEQSTGRRPEILRFPGGSNNRQARKYGGARIMSDVIAAMGKDHVSYFDWNVSSTDAALSVQKREEIVEAVRQGALGKPNIIVLFHDMDKKNTTVEALPEIIQNLKEQGYRFDVLSKDSVAIRFSQL